MAENRTCPWCSRLESEHTSEEEHCVYFWDKPSLIEPRSKFGSSLVTVLVSVVYFAMLKLFGAIWTLEDAALCALAILMAKAYYK